MIELRWVWKGFHGVDGHVYKHCVLQYRTIKLMAALESVVPTGEWSEWKDVETEEE